MRVQPLTVALAALACALFVYAFGLAFDEATAPRPRPYCTGGLCVRGTYVVNPCIVEYEVDGRTVCVRDEDPK